MISAFETSSYITKRRADGADKRAAAALADLGKSDALPLALFRSQNALVFSFGNGGEQPDRLRRKNLA